MNRELEREMKSIFFLCVKRLGENEDMSEKCWVRVSKFEFERFVFYNPTPSFAQCLVLDCSVKKYRTFAHISLLS